MFAYLAFARPPISRTQRVLERKDQILGAYDDKQRELLEFVLGHYIEEGVGERDEEKLGPLLVLKYGAVNQAVIELGAAEEIRNVFVGFQQGLYAPRGPYKMLLIFLT